MEILNVDVERYPWFRKEDDCLGPLKYVEKKSDEFMFDGKAVLERGSS